MSSRPLSATISKEICMMAKAVPLLLAFVVAGCAANKHKLTAPAGSYRALNAGKWTPTKDDLRGPRAPLAPVESPNAAMPQAPAAIAPETGREDL